MPKKLLHLKHIAPDGTSFHFEVLEDPTHLPDWQAHGIDIQPIVNTLPEWVPVGLSPAWYFLQDVLNFKWPWSKS